MTAWGIAGRQYQQGRNSYNCVRFSFGRMRGMVRSGVAGTH